MKAKDITILILVIIIILLTFGIGIYYHLYTDAQNEVVIWSDSAYVYKNKYGDEYAAKKTYILKAEQLLAYNDELYKEYKSLKDNPVVITKTEVITKIDTVETKVFGLKENNDSILWNWQTKDSNYYSISGISGIAKTNGIYNYPFTTINNATMNARLTLDVIDDGKQLSVIAKTDNPYVTLTDMQSVVIDPANSPTIKNTIKKKRWGFGPTISGGVMGGVDFKGQPIFGAGVMIGFSVHYDLFQW